MTVQWVWCGAVTPESALIRGCVGAGSATSLLVSTSSDLSGAVEHGPESVDEDGFFSWDVTGLDSATTYHYGVKVDGVLDETEGKGRFRTFPEPDAMEDVVIVHGSCQVVDSEGPVWARIAEKNPHVVLHGGDAHYSDISEDDEAQYRTAWGWTFQGSAFRGVCRQVPIAHVWDDHDFGTGDSHGGSPSKAAAQAVFRQVVPHYPLNASTGAVWQEFTLGRLRVVLTDLRSERSNPLDAASASKSQMGAEQKEWFKQVLLDAKASGQVVCWLSSVAWRATDGDGWRRYTHERAELANFIVLHRVPVFILSGDIHAIGIDDGTNTAGGIPEMMAAPFEQFASILGPTAAGTYSHGGLLTAGTPYPDIAMQYGLTRVADDGTNMVVTWEAYHVHADGSEEVLASLTFSPLVQEPAVVHVWDGSAWQPAVAHDTDGPAGTATFVA